MKYQNEFFMSFKDTVKKIKGKSHTRKIYM